MYIPGLKLTIHSLFFLLQVGQAKALREEAAALERDAGTASTSAADLTKRLAQREAQLAAAAAAAADKVRGGGPGGGGLMHRKAGEEIADALRLADD